MVKLKIKYNDGFRRRKGHGEKRRPTIITAKSGSSKVKIKINVV